MPRAKPPRKATTAIEFAFRRRLRGHARRGESRREPQAFRNDQG